MTVLTVLSHIKGHKSVLIMSLVIVYSGGVDVNAGVNGVNVSSVINLSRITR